MSELTDKSIEISQTEIRRGKKGKKQSRTSKNHGTIIKVVTRT